MSATKKADYGIDAPPVVRNLALAGIATIIAGIAIRFILTSPPSMQFNYSLQVSVPATLSNAQAEGVTDRDFG